MLSKIMEDRINKISKTLRTEKVTNKLVLEYIKERETLENYLPKAKEQDELMQEMLEMLKKSRLDHYYCDDNWFSCPKHEEGCANESQGNECNCGADKYNLELDKIIQKAS